MPLPFSRRPLATTPSFSRDFAGLKTLDHGVGPAITFTRGSNATYFDANGTLQTASTDTPRFDHSGGNSLGLLIEESRANLFQRSAEFDDAYWTKSQASITADAVIAPDGTQTADKLVEDASNDIHFVSRSIAVVTGADYALTVFAKKGERTFFRAQSFNASGDAQSAIFNLDTGTIESGTSGSTITAVGGGWFRCYVPVQNNTDTFSSISFQLYSDATTSTYTGDGSSGIYLWGAQIEQGAFPTSYIPTTTAAATRAADSAVVTPISSFYNQAEGTLFAEFRSGVDLSGPRVVQIDDEASSSIQIIAAASGGAGAYFFTNISGINKATAPPSNPNLVANTVYKVAGSVSSAGVFASRNGETAAQSANGEYPTGLTRMIMGGSGVTAINGHIRRMAYYPKRLSNELLQQLTT